MTLPSFTMRELLEAGVHFGHHTRRWNPKMEKFIFGERDNTHIINLDLTVPMLHRSLQAIYEVASSGGRVLFVGTKRQASGPIAEAAKKCGQYFVNHRWLGGMLTNWSTVSKSIKKLKELEEVLNSESAAALTKKEVLNLTRSQEKLEKTLGGIREMGGSPDMLVILDVNKEDLALNEANVLGIPVVAIVDTNCSPDGITYPIPGNDDAVKSINLYLDLFSQTILQGMRKQMVATKKDIGEMENPPVEKLDDASNKKEADAKAEEKKEEKKPAKKAAPKKTATKKAAADKKKEEVKEEKKAPAKKATKKAAASKEDAPKKAPAKKAAPKKAAKKADEEKASK